MRPILFLALLSTLLFFPTVNFAETGAECRTKCADEKTARDADCPPGEDTDEEHAQCLQESQSRYNDCMSSCPQPEAADKPAEN